VGVLSRFMSCPKRDHMSKNKGMLPYLRGKTRLAVMFGGNEALKWYVDADWAGDTNGRR